MHRLRRFAIFLALTLTTAATGCDVLSAGDELTLYVAPHTAECVGVAPQTCLVVKERRQDEWGLFYDGIAGFEYEPGFEYTLRVSRRRIRNPPADGSSLEYRLIRMVAKVPAAEPAP